LLALKANKRIFNMSNDIRLTRLKLEAIEINSKLSPELQELFRNNLQESSQINENKMIDWFKSKVMSYFDKHQADDIAKELPTLKQKEENAKQQAIAQGKEQAVDKLQQGMEQIKSEFKTDENNVNKITAMLSVLATTALLALTAVPAASSLIFIGLALGAMAAMVPMLKARTDISNAKLNAKSRLLKTGDTGLDYDRYHAGINPQ
jgi:hypothetical protein